jgi:membrane fusion protein (multidrug efflux system)
MPIRLNSVKYSNNMKSLLLFLPALLIFGCSTGPAQQQAPPPPETEVVTIASGNATTDNEYTAAIEGKVNVEIRPQVEGALTAILVDEGAFVTAGQPLFRINDLPYREAYNSAVASLHAAQAAIATAQLEIDKITPLVQSRVVSPVQLKTATAARQMAVANAEQAKAAVATAQINLGYTTIKAPVSGYIGRLPKKQGSLVGRTDPEALTTLSDVREVYAYFSLSEGDFIRFKERYPGGTVNEKLKALPPVSLLLADNSVYGEPGRVTMVDGQFDKTTGAITLRASFPNPQGLLRSGNTGRIRMEMPHDGAILVPASATVEMQDKIFVYKLGDSNKVAKQPIAVIGKNGQNYLVEDGVQAGDKIVYNGLDHLQDGIVIKPVAPKSNEQLSMRK